MLQFRLVGLGLGTGKSKQCHENENTKKFQNSNSCGYLVWGVGFFLFCISIDISIFVFWGPAGFGLGNDQFEAGRTARFSFLFAMGTLSQRNERRVHVCSTNQSTGLYYCRILVTLA